MATDIKELREKPSEVLQTRAWSGVVSQDATDATEGIMVVLPDFDEDLHWGPCYWTQRTHDDFPQKGDQCLVVFDNTMQPWVLMFWTGRDPMGSDWLGSYPVVTGDIHDDAVTPDKIQPSATNGHVLKTVGGATVWAAP